MALQHSVDNAAASAADAAAVPVDDGSLVSITSAADHIGAVSPSASGGVCAASVGAPAPIGHAAASTHTAVVKTTDATLTAVDAGAVTASGPFSVAANSRSATETPPDVGHIDCLSTTATNLAAAEAPRAAAASVSVDAANGTPEAAPTNHTMEAPASLVAALSVTETAEATSNETAEATAVFNALSNPSVATAVVPAFRSIDATAGAEDKPPNIVVGIECAVPDVAATAASNGAASGGDAVSEVPSNVIVSFGNRAPVGCGGPDEDVADAAAGDAAVTGSSGDIATKTAAVDAGGSTTARHSDAAGSSKLAGADCAVLPASSTASLLSTSFSFLEGFENSSSSTCGSLQLLHLQQLLQSSTSQHSSTHGAAAKSTQYNGSCSSSSGQSQRINSCVNPATGASSYASGASRPRGRGRKCSKLTRGRLLIPARAKWAQIRAERAAAAAQQQRLQQLQQTASPAAAEGAVVEQKGPTSSDSVDPAFAKATADLQQQQILAPAAADPASAPKQMENNSATIGEVNGGGKGGPYPFRESTAKLLEPGVTPQVATSVAQGSVVYGGSCGGPGETIAGTSNVLGASTGVADAARSSASIGGSAAVLGGAVMGVGEAAKTKRKLAEGDLMKFGSLTLLPGKPRKWQLVPCRVGNVNARVWRPKEFSEDPLLQAMHALMQRQCRSARRSIRHTRALAARVKETAQHYIRLQQQQQFSRQQHTHSNSNSSDNPYRPVSI